MSTKESLPERKQCAKRSRDSRNHVQSSTPTKKKVVTSCQKTQGPPPFRQMYAKRDDYCVEKEFITNAHLDPSDPNFVEMSYHVIVHTDPVELIGKVYEKHTIESRLDLANPYEAPRTFSGFLWSVDEKMEADLNKDESSIGRVTMDLGGHCFGRTLTFNFVQSDGEKFVTKRRLVDWQVALLVIERFLSVPLTIEFVSDVKLDKKDAEFWQEEISAAISSLKDEDKAKYVPTRGNLLCGKIWLESIKLKKNLLQMGSIIQEDFDTCTLEFGS